MSVPAPLRLSALAAAALAAAGIVGIALSDGPHLSFSGVSPWVVVWALGLFGLLACAPFELHRRVSARTEDPDRRWELAIVAWGAVALAGLAGFALLGVLAGFSGSSGSGAISLTGLAECGLVVSAVLLLMLTTG